MLDDGHGTRSAGLGPGDTMHVPPAVWLEIEAIAPPVSVLVLADGEYDPDDYVTDRSQLPIALARAAATNST